MIKGRQNPDSNGSSIEIHICKIMSVKLIIIKYCSTKGGKKGIKEGFLNTCTPFPSLCALPRLRKGAKGLQRNVTRGIEASSGLVKIVR